MIKRIIVEGADQQGKTTICNALKELTGWDIIHYGPPPPRFDFFADYLIPPNTISDRNFLSEMVYSHVRGEDHRIKRIDDLQDIMIAQDTLLVLADRWEYFTFDNREEQYTESQIRIARRLYRAIFRDIRLAKLSINPNINYQRLENLVNENYQRARIRG